MLTNHLDVHGAPQASSCDLLFIDNDKLLNSLHRIISVRVNDRPRRCLPCRQNYSLIRVGQVIDPCRIALHIKSNQYLAQRSKRHKC